MRLLVGVLFLLAAGCGSGSVEPVTVSGTLADGDFQLTSGEFYDSFDLRAREGQWIRVEVTALGFDPYLILRSPNGEQVEIDDSDPHDPSTASMTIRAPSSGRWVTLVTSYAPGGVGHYTITYQVADESPTDDPAYGQPNDEGLIEV